MSIKKLPPSGNAVGAWNLLFAGNGGFSGRFAERSRFAAHDTLFTGSATGAMYLALLGMKRLRPGKTEVVIPAWCCPSVAQAVLQAELVPVLADLDPDTFAYSAANLRTAVTERTLTVLLVHFFGIRVPVPDLSLPSSPSAPSSPALPSDAPVTPPFFLRDCAQDFFFRRDAAADHPTFYSFGRGKSLNGGHGGALCLPPGSPLLNPCREALEGFTDVGNPLPKALLINLLSHPLLFGLLTRLPMLRIGETKWEAPLVFTRMHPSFPRLAEPMLDALDRNLHVYADLIGGYARLQEKSQGKARAPWRGYEPGNAPIRFPLLIEDPTLRRTFMEGLNGSFGGVTGQYPDLLPNLAGAPAGMVQAGPYPGCERIAKQIVTLPITAWLRGCENRFLAHARMLLSAETP
ncbi:MAG: DegT/DnrJ/EryC1/StrS family aminotransferase [Fibrobacteria bacterium]